MIEKGNHYEKNRIILSVRPYGSFYSDWLLRQCRRQRNLGTVTLSEYKGVTVNIEAPEVTDEEVDTKVETILAQNPNEVEGRPGRQGGRYCKYRLQGNKGRRSL